MTPCIIVGFADTPGGRDALALGVALAALLPDAQLVVTTIYAYNPPVVDHEPSGWRKDLRDRAARELDAARAALPVDAEATLRVACGLSTADGLHRLADELDAAAIVVGTSHEHGLDRIVHGSATEQTLLGAPCPVAVAPRDHAARPAHRIRRIVVADNGSPEAERARLVAADIARAAHAELDLVGVCDQVAVWYGAYMGEGADDEVRAAVRAQLEDARTRLPGLDVVRIRVREGNPVTILRELGRDADLLVLGSRNHGPLARTLLGSVSSPLLRRPTCPLVVVPRTAKEPRTAAAHSTPLDAAHA